MTILIVHYNTPALTKAAVASIRKTTPGARVIIFDNSDRNPYTGNGVDIIDNTRGQLVDWSSWLQRFSDRRPTTNNHGSAKHCYSVDYCMRTLKEPFVLLDSDVLVKRDLWEIWNENCIFVGEIDNSSNHFINIPRVLPYCCFINTTMCLLQGVSYFHPHYCWKLTKENPARFYDTGAWFLRQCCEKWLWDKMRTIHYEDFVEHLGLGSYGSKSVEEWLDAHRELWT